MINLAHQEPLDFKFRWLDEQGSATSMFAKKGHFEGETLTLEDVELPVAAIVQSLVRDNRMVLSVMTGDPEQPTAHLLIQPASKKVTEELKSMLDIARSSIWAKQHRDELQSRGLGQTYRDAVCPECSATVILTDMPESPQLYCHFCDTLVTTDRSAEPIAGEAAFKICEECGMYSKPRKFTIFYFYFLVVIYGWWSNSTWRCPACMRGEAWKMFFGNLIFVLGVPVAITQLIRSYGSDQVSGKFKGLDTGNLKARRGNVNGALQHYEAIMERVPYAAGIKYNLATALLASGDPEKAAQVYELALDDCSNYAPAYQQLRALYAHLGRKAELVELERMWSSGGEEVVEGEVVT